MARTARIGKMHHIEDVPVPPEYMTPEQQEKIGAFDQDAMDVEDGEYGENEGGVLLDVSNIDSPPSNLSSFNNPEMMEVYHQTPVTNLEDTSDLWRLPVTPLHKKRSEVKQAGITHQIALTYHNSCRLIWNHWKCEPTVCIPDDLRRQTPYSLALLSQLRYLATNTKQNFALAQSLLIDSWRVRFHTLTIPDDRTSIHMVETRVSGMPGCEHQIHENVFGLTLHDVSEAHKTLRKYRREGRQQNSKAQQQTKKERQQTKSDRQQMKKERQQAKMEAKLAWRESTRSLIAERVIQRRRDQKAVQNAYLNTDLDDLQDVQMLSHDPDHNGSLGVSVAPPNNPVLAGNTFSLSSEGVRLRNDQNDGGAKTDENRRAVDQTLKNEQNQYNQMSNLINKMGMDGSEQSGRKRLKRLRAGGLSRFGHQPATLPSERVNLNNVPTLHDVASTTGALDLARLGQRPLPD